MKHRAFSPLLAIALCIGCSTTTDLTPNPQYALGLNPGDVLLAKTPIYFMDYPGTDSLVPTDGRYLSQPFTYDEYLSGAARGFDAEHVAGVLPTGTRILFIRVYAHSSYMTDTHTTYVGQLLDGNFKGKKVTINALIDPEYKRDAPPTLRGKYLAIQKSSPDNPQ